MDNTMDNTMDNAASRIIPEIGKLYKIVGETKYVSELESYKQSRASVIFYRYTKYMDLGEIIMYVGVFNNIIENKHQVCLFVDKIEILLYKFLYKEKLIYLECIKDGTLLQIG